MGILKRVNDITLASIHEVLDKVENPLSMIKQYIRELEGQIAQAKLALSNQLLAERKYEAMIAELKHVVLKRIRQANLAIDRNEEEIAQLAVEEKLSCEKTLETYFVQYEAVKQQISVLEGQLQKLKELYDELQSKKLFLMSRANTAHAVHNANSMLHSFDADSIRRNFTRMEEQIWQLESKAAASLRADQLVHGSSAAAADLVFKEDVQHELERLKAARKSNLAE